MLRTVHAVPLLLAALTLAPLPPLPGAARAQSTTRTRVDTTFALEKGASVDLATVSGEILVTGWTRPEARVVARAERGSLEVFLSGSRIAIQPSRRRDNGEAHYELMVPIGTRVRANSTSGDIQIKATAGEVYANTTSGDVEVIDAAGTVEVQTTSGDVHAARLRGRARFGTTSGGLEIEDVAGEVEAKSVSGDISIQRAQTAEVRAETVSGEVTYVGSIEANGRYDFSSHSGDVRLEIPAGAGANLELQTYSGSISSRFPLTLQPGERSSSRRGQRMQFTIGNGGARITAETFSGDITIERSARSGREE